MHFRILIAASLVAGFALPMTANAATDTGSLTVQATVQSSCSLTGGSLNFGTYTSGQTSDLQSQGSIAYSNCPVGNLTFELSGGQSADPANRVMTSNDNSDQLNYQLFRNSSRSAIWGEGSDAQSVQLLAAGGGTVPIFGSIQANQTVSQGSFTDTISVTLNF